MFRSSERRGFSFCRSIWSWAVRETVVSWFWLCEGRYAKYDWRCWWMMSRRIGNRDGRGSSRTTRWLFCGCYTTTRCTVAQRKTCCAVVVGSGGGGGGRRLCCCCCGVDERNSGGYCWTETIYIRADQRVKLGDSEWMHVSRLSVVAFVQVPCEPFTTRSRDNGTTIYIGHFSPHWIQS